MVISMRYATDVRRICDVSKTFVEDSFHLCLAALKNYNFSTSGDRPAMPQESIREPRQIIDRKALKAELEELVAWSGYTPKTQGKVLEIFKRAYRTGWDEVRRRFEDVEAQVVNPPSSLDLEEKSLESEDSFVVPDDVVEYI